MESSTRSWGVRPFRQEAHPCKPFAAIQAWSPQPQGRALHHRTGISTTPQIGGRRGLGHCSGAAALPICPRQGGGPRTFPFPDSQRRQGRLSRFLQTPLSLLGIPSRTLGGDLPLPPPLQEFSVSLAKAGSKGFLIYSDPVSAVWETQLSSPWAPWPGIPNMEFQDLNGEMQETQAVEPQPGTRAGNSQGEERGW